MIIQNFSEPKLFFRLRNGKLQKYSDKQIKNLLNSGFTAWRNTFNKQFKDGDVIVTVEVDKNSGQLYLAVGDTKYGFRLSFNEMRQITCLLRDENKLMADLISQMV